ncbi:MAG: hypothetical protein CVV22_02285 [Ignavibacteriae bacterium HGW-Ignavibacteriae-1]|jgi:hypothetical protein|nr:MAG: hypothetical protein CVV22_02285 [Ignavibacteriae bacterium HGW-Ignavibacteriae-1]
MTKLFLATTIIFIIFNQNSFSQQKGGESKSFNPDSVIIFESPRPLVEVVKTESSINYALGGDLLISDSGFGIGLFYHRFMSNSTVLFSSLYISGARNSNEFDEYDYVNNTWQVNNKINRLFRFPLMFGVQQFVFQQSLDESLKPFISLGFGPTFILENPYTYNKVPNGEIIGWFEAFNHSQWHTRMGGFIGVGAYFGKISESLFGVNVKYYYVPFGDEGLESIAGLPIKNFGGLFISLTIGSTY